MKNLKKINNLFRNIKHRKPSAIYCPKCGDSNIKKSSSFDSWLIPAKYICEKCGYSGILYMELEKKDEGDS